MSLLHLLSYVGIVAAVAFVILSLASGLLWISELIEEHSRTAKIVGIRAVYAITTLHILLYFTDSLPLLHVVFSITAHLVYLQNCSHTWPFISLTSPAFVSSCVLAILNHFAWFFYFSRVSREAQQQQQRARSQTSWVGYGRSSVHVPNLPKEGNVTTAPGFPDIATFFAVCVWFVPLFLFLSLSANDNALPVSGNGFGEPTVASEPSQFGRSSLFKSTLDFLPFLRRRRDRADGILVARTPTPSAPSTPRTSYSGQNPYTAVSRSSFESETPYPSAPSLRSPPRRSNTGPPRSSSPRIPEQGVVMSGTRGHSVKSPSLLASKSASTDDSPVRRRTVAE